MPEKQKSKPLSDKQKSGPEPVRTPQVQAAPCPKNDLHTNTQVYRTAGRTRYCKCNDCGETWKQTGPYADPLRGYCVLLAESLESADRVADPAGGDGEVLVMTAELADSMAAELRRLIV